MTRRVPCPACKRQFVRAMGMAWHFMMVHYFWGYILMGGKYPHADNKKPPP